MEKEEFERLLYDNGKIIGIDLNEAQVENFYKYMNLLFEWNKKMNLTAITDEKDVIIKHFIDSLTISKYIKEKSKVIDVGTGAGFPGIPLKILRDDIDVTLLDSLNKRITFLNEVISSLQLNNIKAIHGRAEEMAKNKLYREKFDVATSRAVANLSTLSEYLLPFNKIDGICLCMKGNDIKKEIDESKMAIQVLGGKIYDVDNFKLPNGDNRGIVIISKISNTPSRYPRKPGIPAKEPIK